jgi:hypothetical protein
MINANIYFQDLLRHAMAQYKSEQAAALSPARNDVDVRIGEKRRESAHYDEDSVDERGAAQILQRSTRTLQHWRSAGGGPPFIKKPFASGGTRTMIRYPLRGLYKFMDGIKEPRVAPAALVELPPTFPLKAELDWFMDPARTKEEVAERAGRYATEKLIYQPREEKAKRNSKKVGRPAKGTLPRSVVAPVPQSATFSSVDSHGELFFWTRQEDPLFVRLCGATLTTDGVAYFSTKYGRRFSIDAHCIRKGSLYGFIAPARVNDDTLPSGQWLIDAGYAVAGPLCADCESTAVASAEI